MSSWFPFGHQPKGGLPFSDILMFGTTGSFNKEQHRKSDGERERERERDRERGIEREREGWTEREG